MDEDVNKAIKQLETIAIKAINSGYLDDAAKVMHIAEEIERVDKSGVASEPKNVDKLGLANEPHNDPAVATDPAARPPRSGDTQDPTIPTLDSDSDAVLGAEQRETPVDVDKAEPEELGSSGKENVISLNKLRMKRGALMRQKSKNTPSSQS